MKRDLRSHRTSNRVKKTYGCDEFRDSLLGRQAQLGTDQGDVNATFVLQGRALRNHAFRIRAVWRPSASLMQEFLNGLAGKRSRCYAAILGHELDLPIRRFRQTHGNLR